MVDMLFYHNKNLYVYYNQHSSIEFTNSFDQSFLCLPWNETIYAPIFFDHRSIKRLDQTETGNQNVTIQNLEKLFAHHDIIDITD